MIVLFRFSLVNICQKYNFDWGEVLVLKLDTLSKILLMSDLSCSERDFLFHFAALCKIFSAYINDTTISYDMSHDKGSHDGLPLDGTYHKGLSEEKLSHDKLTHDKLSHDKLFHDKLSHNKQSRKKLSHDKLSHDKLSHKKLSYDKLSHKKLSHDKLSHNKLSHKKLSHDKVSHEKVSHNKLCHDKLSLDRLYVCITIVWISSLTLEFWLLVANHLTESGNPRKNGNESKQIAPIHKWRLVHCRIK